MAKEAKTALTFAEIVKLASAEIFTLGGMIPKLNNAVVSACDKFTNSLQQNAKVVAALKRRYIERLNAKEIPQDLPFSSKKPGKGGYFEQNCGGLLPGRVESLAALFNSLVLTPDAQGNPLLTEKNYDAAKVDWLEKANAIVATAQEELGENWMSSGDIGAALNSDLKKVQPQPCEIHESFRRSARIYRPVVARTGEWDAVLTAELHDDIRVAAMRLNCDDSSGRRINAQV